MSSIKTKQPTIFRMFSKLIKTQMLQHAYLFEGKVGTGKKETARWIAKASCCPNISEDLIPCEECYQCVRINTKQHPDVIEIVPEGLSIKIDQVRELKDEFSKSGVESKQKIIIIEDVEKMTVNAANSLLKFLEEPEGQTTAFLLTSAKQKLIPTVISRCQVVQFQTRTIEYRLQELNEVGLNDNKAAVLSHLTQSNEEALRLDEETNLSDIIDVVWRWSNLIIKKEEQSFVFVHTDVMPILNNRDDQHLALDLLLFVYRDLLHLYFNDNNQITFLKYKDKLNGFRSGLSLKEISLAMEYILEAKKKLNSHVQAQGVFEDISLHLI